MEKLKEILMKLCNTAPNKPLSEAQKSIIQKKLNEILPLLHHTPEHPPYAWMIQKAIQELADKGNSSEQLISKYIKNEYKDLPWAHDKLLNHHLKSLCESGDIVLTSNQQYALPVLHSAAKSRKKFRKKHAKRKQDWEWYKKKNKRKKKQVGKDYLMHRDDKDHLIAEERPSCESKGQKALGKVHDMQIIDMCSSDVRLNPGGQQLDAEAYLIAEERTSCDSEEQNFSKEVHEMQIVDICSSDALLNQEGQLLDDDQTEASPERAPGFGSVLESIDLPKSPQGFALSAPELSCASQKQVHSCVNNELKHVQSPPLEVSANKNQGEVQMVLSSDGASDTRDQSMQALQPATTTTDIGLWEIDCGEHHAMLTQAKPTVVCNQQKIPESKPPTDEASVSESQPVHFAGSDRVQRIVYQYKKRPPGEKGKANQMKKQRLTKAEPLQQDQRELDEKPVAPLTLSPLDPQDTEHIDSNKLQKSSSRTMKALEHQGLQRRCQDKCQAQEASSQVTGMQRKLRSWKKKTAEHFNSDADLSVALHNKDSHESSALLNIDKSPQLDKQCPQERPLKRVLQSQPLVPELSNSASVVEEQQQPQNHRRGRPPKAKPGMMANALGPIVHQCQQELGPSIPQNQQNTFQFSKGQEPEDKPKNRGRGRPPKVKRAPSAIIKKRLASGVLMHKPENRGRGRPRKIMEGE